MSLSYPRNPKYGSVAGICRELGYDINFPQERQTDVLSRQTNEYRKHYIITSGVLREFPLDYITPSAQNCATSFLEDHQTWFPDTEEAFTSGWPVYPKDRDRIVELVAKLMCQQEFYSQMNQYQKEAKRVKDITPNFYPQSQNSPDVYDIESTSEIYIPIQEYPHVQRSKAAQPNEVDRISEDSDNISDDEEMGKRIKFHLDCIYPLNGPPDGQSTEWIFQSTPCPDDILPFVSRYLHDRNIYSSGRKNYDAIYEFSMAMKLHFKLTCTSLEEHILFTKCDNLVRRMASKWKNEGFIVGVIGQLRKHQHFQESWKLRRDIWIQEKHGGNTKDVIEILYHESKNRHNHDTCRKRSADVIDLSQSSPKRISQSTNIDPHFVLNQHNQNTLSSEGLYDTPPVVNTFQFAPEANMYGPQNSTFGGECNISYVHVSGKEQHPTSCPIPTISEERSPHIEHFEANSCKEAFSVVASPEKSEDIAVACSNSSNTPNEIEEDPEIENSGPYSKQGASNSSTPSRIIRLRMPRKSITPVGNSPDLPEKAQTDGETKPPEVSAKTIGPKKPKKQVLQILTEDHTNKLDEAPESIISEATLENLTREGLFNLVSERTRKSLTSLHYLTWRYLWEGKKPVLISSNMDEDDWDDFKETVLDYYGASKDEMPEKRIFQISVRCGDTRNLGNGRRGAEQ